MKTIRGKFLVLIIVGFVCLATVLCAVSLVMTRDILHEDADDILNATAAKEANALNRTLRNASEASHVIETYLISEIKDLDRLRLNKQHRESVTKLAGDMFYNIARNTEGIEAFYVRYEPSVLGNLSHRAQAGFFVTYDDAKRDYVNQTPTNLELYSPDDMGHVGWFYEAKRAEDPIWLAPYYNENTESYIISYVVPLYCGDTFFGVVGVDINFAEVTGIVDSIRVYENGYAYLTDSNSNVIYEPGDTVKNEVSSDHSTSAGVLLDNGMNLVVIASYDDIQDDSTTLFFTIAIISLLLLIPFIIICVIFTNRMTLPLKNLTSAARQLATGDTSVHLECDTNDEIGELSGVFNETVLKIRDYMTYVNSLAYRDGLTGIKNRTAFIEAIAKMNKKISEAPYNTAFGVLLADVNGLKKANDIYGHSVGNQLLKAVSQVLCDTFKRSPVFRIGGDEFVVILENADYARYKTLIKELDAAYMRTFIELENDKLPVMVARGISIYFPGNDTCFDDVSKRADREMYVHKELMKRNTGEIR